MVFSGSRRAFSMLELTVVLVIVSILSTLGILSYANMRSSIEANSAAQRIVATMATARQAAITANLPHQVFFARGESSFWVDELDAAGVAKRRQIENPGSLPEFIQFQSFVVAGAEQPGDTVTVRFWPDGHSETATIVLRRSRDGADDPKKSATIKLFGPTGTAQAFSGERQ